MVFVCAGGGCGSCDDDVVAAVVVVRARRVVIGRSLVSILVGIGICCSCVGRCLYEVGI